MYVKLNPVIGFINVVFCVKGNALNMKTVRKKMAKQEHFEFYQTYEYTLLFSLKIDFRVISWVTLVGGLCPAVAVFQLN